MSDKTKGINPANTDSECPACKTCRTGHCKFRKCETYMDWLHDTWEAIQMKWKRDL